MDYSRHLIMYSGGADSTYFLETEPTAKYLIHYRSPNPAQTRLAVINANLENRFIEVVNDEGGGSQNADGETNQIHALQDTMMVLDACSRALHKGMKGVVVCFTADDLGIDIAALEAITRRVDPTFEILTPLIGKSDAEIRNKRSGNLRHISCMVSENCGYCAKCRKAAKLAQP